MKRILLLAFITLIFGQLYSQVDLRKGLVAYYPFSGNAEDSSMNGNDGIVLGATLTTDRFGDANRAYYFDGTGAYIRVEADPSIEPDSFITVSLWVKPDDFSVRQSALVKRLFHNADPYNSYGFMTNEAAGNVNQKWSFGISNGTPGSSQGALGPTVDTSKWTHLVGTYDGSYIKFYVDGVMVAQSAKTGKIGYSDSTLRIGLAIPGSSLQHFKGKIDDVRIYGRALNQAEIDLLYSNAIGTNLTPVDNSSTMYVYPNPSNGAIFVSQNFDSSPYNVFDLAGKMVSDGVVENGQLTIVDLAPGTYVLTLISKEGNVSTSRIVKN